MRHATNLTKRRLAIGLTLGLLVVLTTGVPALAQAAMPRDRLVSIYAIGRSSDDPANRDVGWNIREQGWTGFVDRYVKPEIEWGVRRLELHNPFGTLPDEVMQADQYLEARDAGLDWLYKDFVDAWTPITNGSSGPGVEIIAYIGSLFKDQDFVDLYEAGDIEGWNRRARESIALPLAAGMSIGLDNVTLTAADHPAFAFAQQLRDEGVRVYVEGWAAAQDDHWADFDHLISNRLYANAIDSDQYLDLDRIAGEIIHRVQQENFDPWPTVEREFEHFREILANGETAQGAVRRLIRAGYTLDDLFPPVATRLPALARLPEPATAALLALGLPILLTRRRA